MQPVQRRGPAGAAELAGPVYDIAFAQGTKLGPVGGEQFVPRLLQGAGGPLHDVVAAQDGQDLSVAGGPQVQAPGDLAPRVRQRRGADGGQVVFDALGKAARRRRGKTGPQRPAVQGEHHVEVGGGAEPAVERRQPG